MKLCNCEIFPYITLSIYTFSKQNWEIIIIIVICHEHYLKQYYVRFLHLLSHKDFQIIASPTLLLYTYFIDNPILNIFLYLSGIDEAQTGQQESSLEDDPTPPSYSPLSDTQEDKSTEEGNIISHDISGEDTDSASEVSICSRVNAIYGLKFVGDNVDKNIRPSFFALKTLENHYIIFIHMLSLGTYLLVHSPMYHQQKQGLNLLYFYLQKKT